MLAARVSSGHRLTLGFAAMSANSHMSSSRPRVGKTTRLLAMTLNLDHAWYEARAFARALRHNLRR